MGPKDRRLNLTSQIEVKGYLCTGGGAKIILGYVLLVAFPWRESRCTDKKDITFHCNVVKWGSK